MSPPELPVTRPATTPTTTPTTTPDQEMGPPPRRDPLLKVDGQARSLARRLLRCADVATLATLAPNDGSKDGLAACLPPGFADAFPFASLVTVATAYDGAPLLLLSQLSVHTRALQGDPRCSLLLRQSTSTHGDPLAQPRLSIVGEALRLDRNHPQRPAMLDRFLARHPTAARYADFPDFDLYRVQVAAALLNGGFARAFALGRDDLITSLGDDLAAFTDAAPTIVVKLNTEHAEEVRLMAQQFGGDMAPGAWRVVGLDPGGIDLKSEQHSIRVDFDAADVSATRLGAHVAKLVAQARERGDH